MNQADPQQTIVAVARDMVTELAPDELVFFDVISADFFTDDRARRRAVDGVLSGKGRDEPIAFDVADGVQTVTTLVLAILNGVACEVLAAQVTRRTGCWWRWRRRRRLSGAVPPGGGATPLPRMSAVEAAAVGRLAQEIATDAGVEAEPAQRIATFVAAALTVRPPEPASE
jgi:hypothetical protein